MLSLQKGSFYLGSTVFIINVLRLLLLPIFHADESHYVLLNPLINCGIAKPLGRHPSQYGLLGECYSYKLMVFRVTLLCSVPTRAVQLGLGG